MNKDNEALEVLYPWMKEYNVRPDEDFQGIRDNVGNLIPFPLPQHIIDGLPAIYRDVTGLYKGPYAHTELLFGMFTILSSVLPNYTVTHNYHDYGACIMCITFGSSGSGKGKVGDMLKLIKGINARLREDYKLELKHYRKVKRRYDMKQKMRLRDHNTQIVDIHDTSQEDDEPEMPVRKMVILPESTTKANLHEMLAINEPDGSLYFCSEIGTLIASNANDFGQFIDLFLRAYQEEPMQRGRKTDAEDIRIENPRLAVLLTGTPDVLRRLGDIVESGFTNRFFFMHLPTFSKYIREPKKMETISHKEVMGKYATIVTELYDTLRDFDNCLDRVRLEFTEQQHEYINHEVEERLNYYFGSYAHEDVIPIVLRRALDMKRLLMQITLFRRYDECGNWDDVFASNILYPDDDDIDLALQIMDYAIKQSKHAYEVIALKEGEVMQKRFIANELCDMLSHEFTAADAVQLCKDNE